MSKNRTNNRGKVVKEFLGYNVRPMVEKIESNKFNRGVSQKIHPKGTYGLYAKKNLLKDGFKTVDEAIQYCSETYTKNNKS